MIVVGFLGAAGRDGELALEVATRAAATGARVEMVGAAPSGPEGDRRLLALAEPGVGHATVIRSGADRLDAADLELALRYLPDLRAIVLVAPEPQLLPPAAAAAGWSGAALVLVLSREVADTIAVPHAIVLEPPPSDPDATFAGFVAALAVRLDAGDDPATAWQATASSLAVDPVS